MLVLPVPDPILQKIDRPRRGLFWKGAAKCSRGDYLVAWPLACRDIDDGGVGFKDLVTLNTSLLLKHIHRIFHRGGQPLADLIRLWYDGRHADADTPSWSFFKSLILQYRALTAVELGDDTTTSFWHDEWAEAGRLIELLLTLYSHCLDTDVTVEEVVVAGGLTRDQLQPRVSSAAQHKLSLLEAALLSVELRDCPDARRMAISGAGRICTVAFYSALRESAVCPPMADINWQGFAPKKVKVFFWVLRHGRTRTRAALHRHGAIDTPDCLFCVGIEEDVCHLFIDCPRLQGCGNVSSLTVPPSSIQDAAESIAGLFTNSPAALGHTAALGALWVIRKTQNRRVFYDITVAPRAVVNLLEEHLKFWVCRQ